MIQEIHESRTKMLVADPKLNGAPTRIGDQPHVVDARSIHLGNVLRFHAQIFQQMLRTRTFLAASDWSSVNPLITGNRNLIRGGIDSSTPSSSTSSIRYRPNATGNFANATGCRSVIVNTKRFGHTREIVTEFTQSIANSCKRRSRSEIDNRLFPKSPSKADCNRPRLA